jgi:hypothetical protein
VISIGPGNVKSRVVEPDPVHLPVPEQALAQALESSDSAEEAQRGVQGDATLSARPFLQVVSDLYERWLMDGNVWDQLKTVWERLKDGLLPANAKVRLKLSEKSRQLVPSLGGLGGAVIKEGAVRDVV